MKLQAKSLNTWREKEKGFERKIMNIYQIFFSYTYSETSEICKAIAAFLERINKRLR